MRWTVTGGASALRPAATRAAGHAVRLGVDPARGGMVELAVHELLANALEHGHADDPDLPIGLRVTREAARVMVQVTDHAVRGPWQGPTGDGARTRPDACRGRGWQLVTAVGSRARVADAGGATVVRVALPTLPGAGTQPRGLAHGWDR